MSIPETTSAEAFERYVGGKCLFESRGEAWRDIKAWSVALPPVVETVHLPSVSEPFLAWTTSGEVDFQERENEQPWMVLFDISRVAGGTQNPPNASIIESFPRCAPSVPSVPAVVVRNALNAQFSY